MPEKKKTLEDHLIKRIKESGYPLEIEISTLLDNEYLVFNTQYYFDEETKQGRDIDIYAIPLLNVDLLVDDVLTNRFAPFRLRTEIAVECKKSDTHAWVFYTRPLVHPSHIHISAQYRDNFSHSSIPSSVESFLFDNLKLHYDYFEKVAIAYDEIKKTKKEGKTKARREIFEAVVQLIKFLCYEMGPAVEPSAPTTRFNILILFPIIVFDGDMFEVTLKSGRPKLERKKFLLLKTHYRSPYSQKVEGFLIDIVHRSYFPRFMEILNRDFARIQNVILENRDRLAKRANETWQEYEIGKKEGTFG